MDTLLLIVSIAFGVFCFVFLIGGIAEDRKLLYYSLFAMVFSVLTFFTSGLIMKNAWRDRVCGIEIIQTNNFRGIKFNKVIEVTDNYTIYPHYCGRLQDSHIYSIKVD